MAPVDGALAAECRHVLRYCTVNGRRLSDGWWQRPVCYI